MRCGPVTCRRSHASSICTRCFGSKRLRSPPSRAQRAPLVVRSSLISQPRGRRSRHYAASLCQSRQCSARRAFQSAAPAQWRCLVRSCTRLCILTSFFAALRIWTSGSKQPTHGVVWPSPLDSSSSTSRWLHWIRVSVVPSYDVVGRRADGRRIVLPNNGSA